jgi:dTMP kinase
MGVVVNNSKYHGKLFVFEGLDGSGKTSVSSEVAAYFRSHKYPVVHTNEPEGWTRIGVALSKVLKSIEMLPDEEALLFTAARIAHKQRIEKWLSDGYLVFSDRYWFSTFAYQVGGKGLDPRIASFLTFEIAKPVEPDVLFYIDVSVDTAIERMDSRNSNDMLDINRREFLTRVSNAYDDLLKILSRNTVVRINNDRPIDYAIDECVRYVRDFVE